MVYYIFYWLGPLGGVIHNTTGPEFCIYYSIRFGVCNSFSDKLQKCRAVLCLGVCTQHVRYNAKTITVQKMFGFFLSEPLSEEDCV